MCKGSCCGVAWADGLRGTFFGTGEGGCFDGVAAVGEKKVVCFAQDDKVIESLKRGFWPEERGFGEAFGGDPCGYAVDVNEISAALCSKAFEEEWPMLRGIWLPCCFGFEERDG